MKAITNDFKNALKGIKEVDAKVTYTIDSTEYELGMEELNSIRPHYEGAILKSVMKALDLDSNVEIPNETILNLQFGVKTRSGKNLFDKDTQNYVKGYYLNSSGVETSGTNWGVYYIPVEPNTSYTISGCQTNGGVNFCWFNSSKGFISNIGQKQNRTNITSPNNAGYLGLSVVWNTTSSAYDGNTLQVEVGSSATPYEAYGMYDYINYGNYVVYSSEKQEDTNSYFIKCYDKMLYSMKDYESFGVTYPITIQNYLSALCTHLGLTLKSSNFTNYNKQLEKELYLDENGKSLGYTFRDVLDEIAQVTASTICINEDDDELEVRYLNNTSTKNLISTDKIVASTIKNKVTNNFTYYRYWATPVITNENILNILQPSTTYTISFKYKVLERPSTFGQYNTTSIFALYGGSQTFWLSDNEKNTIALNKWKSSSFTITLPADLTGYRLLAYTFKDADNTTIGEIEIDELQIEQNNVKTYFEPYGMDLIDEEFFDENNVNFGEVYGPINTVILSRSAESDEIAKSIPSNLSDDLKIAIKISENQILNFDNREEYLDNILNRLYGLTYTQNNFSSKGICYYDLCDKYASSIFGKIYNCVMLNDDIIIEKGLSENVTTEMPEIAETDYSKTSTTDKMERKTALIVDKQVGEIRGEVSGLNDQLNDENGVVTKLTKQGQTLDIWSKSFDDNGNVIALNTTNYTFDSEGLKIGKSTDDYNLLQNNTGTYYYEKDTMVGKYTKEGSVQKDMALFGRYYYGIDEENFNVEEFSIEKANFVAQWYKNGNEEGFGHFWNGE